MWALGEGGGLSSMVPSLMGNAKVDAYNRYHNEKSKI